MLCSHNEICGEHGGAFRTVPDEDVLREWISLSGPEKDSWEDETGRTALQLGLVFFPGDATMGFEEFMAGRTRNSTDREMEDEATTCRRVTTKFGFVLAEASTRERKKDPSEHTVLLEEFEGSTSGYLDVRDTGVAPLTCNEDGNWMGSHPERRHGERPRVMGGMGPVMENQGMKSGDGCGRRWGFEQ